MFNRQVILYSPWHVLEPDRGQLTLSPGSSQKIKIAFRPTLTGEAKYVLGLSRSKDGLCNLTAEALDPFSFAVKEAELILNKKTRRRTAEIGVINHGKKPILLNVLASRRIQQSAGNSLVLMPGDKNKMNLFLPPNDVDSFEGGVELSLENGYGKSVDLFSKVVPGEIKVEVVEALSSEVINFGRVMPGRGIDRQFVVKNIGGEVIPLEFEVPPPFQLLSRPINQLAPLATAQFTLGLYTDGTQKGALDETMKVMSNAQVVPVRLLGNAIKPKPGFRMSTGPASSPPASQQQQPTQTPAPSTAVNRVAPPIPLTSQSKPPKQSQNQAAAASLPPKPKPKPGSLLLDDTKPGTIVSTKGKPKGELKPVWALGLSKEELEAMRSPLGFLTRTMVRRNTSADLKGAEDVKIVRGGKTKLTLGWTAPKDAALYKYVVEKRALVAMKGEAMADNFWIPHEQVEFERIGRLVKAKVTGLIPNRNYELRVITLDNNEKAALPSEAIIAKTELPMDWTYIYAGMGVILLGALVWAIRKVISERRGEVYQSQYVE